MKRFPLLWNILIAAAALFAAAFLLLRWIGTAEDGLHFACIYAPGSADAMDYDAVAAGMAEDGYQVTVTASSDAAADAEKAIRGGTSLLVVGLDAVPADDALLQTAAAHQAVLLFTGVYPGAEYLESGTNAYYIGSHAENAGEMLGNAAAMAYRAGTLPDTNGDLLLEYLSAGADSDYSRLALQCALQEAEHYGVYTQSCLPQTADAAAVETAASDTEAGQTASSAAVSAAAAESAALSAAADSAQTAASAAQSLTPAESWQNADAAPEIIFCFGADAVQQAEDGLQAMNWADSGVQLYVYAASRAQAERAAQDTRCARIVYYDRDTVTQFALQMLLNAAQQKHITQGTGLSVSDASSVWVPLAPWPAVSAADSAASAADSTASDASPADSAA